MLLANPNEGAVRKTPDIRSVRRYQVVDHTRRRVRPALLLPEARDWERLPSERTCSNTKYRAEVVEQSKNSLQIAIEDSIADDADPLIGPVVIHEGRLREVVCRTARDPSLVPRYLSLMGYERESAKRVMVDSSRGAIWVHTESWKGGDTVEYLKARMRGMPELDDPLFE